MIPMWLKRWAASVRANDAARRPTPRVRFTPRSVALEDRSVPATFFVDPGFAGSAAGDFVTFNAGLPGEKAGLIFGTTAFADIPSALTAANNSAGVDDTIQLSNGTHQVDPNANGGPFTVTDDLAIVGSGQDVTNIRTIGDTKANSGTQGAVFLAQDVDLDISAFTFEGNGDTALGVLTGSAFRYESATGTVDNVTIRNVIDDSAGNFGFGIVAIGDTTTGSKVDVSDSLFINNGRTGVRYDSNSTGSVTGSLFTGRGLDTLVNYGVEVTEGSKNVLISGNTFVGHSGKVGTFTSAGIQIADDLAFDFTVGGSNAATNADQPASATILGNSFTSNETAIIVGISDTLDDSNAVIQGNNIAGNKFGILADTTKTVNALFNFFGGPQGPLAIGNTTAAGDNPGGIATSEVSDNVLYRDPAITPNGGILVRETPVLVATSPEGLRSQLPPVTVSVAVAPGQANPTNGSAKFTVTFGDQVFGVTKSSFTVTGPGSPAISSVTPSADGKTFTVEVTGATGTGPVTLSVPATGTTTVATSVGNITLPTVRSDIFAGAGAAPASATVNVDTQAATVAISSPQASFSTNPVTVTFTFSDPVTGFDASDITVSGGLAAGSKATIGTITPSADNKTFNVQISGFNQAGPITVGLNANAVTDAAGNKSAAFTQANVTQFAITPAAGFAKGFAIGAEIGSRPFFTVDDQFNVVSGTIPFEAGFTGGVRVATADVNNDGVLDVIAGAGVGRVNEVRVFDGANAGKQLLAFNPFETSFNLGVYVSAADLNGDGFADIIVSPDQGGGPRVRVLDGKAASGGTLTQLANFFGIDDQNFRGGARVGAGDLNNDGTPDIAVAAGFLGGPRVTGWSGKTVLAGQAGAAGVAPLFNILAYEDTVRNGTYVGVRLGDINGDGFADLLTGAGPDGGPRVRVFSGKQLVSGGGEVSLGDFFGGGINTTNRGGIRVTTANLDGDNRADVIVGPGTNGGGVATVYFGSAITPGTQPAAGKTIDLSGNALNGIFVG